MLISIFVPQQIHDRVSCLGLSALNNVFLKKNYMSAAAKVYKRVTTNALIEMKASETKISMLTAYD